MVVYKNTKVIRYTKEKIMQQILAIAVILIMFIVILIIMAVNQLKMAGISDWMLEK